MVAPSTIEARRRLDNLLQLVETDRNVRSAFKRNPTETLRLHGLSEAIVRRLANDIYGSDGCNDGTCYVSACPDTCFVTLCGTTDDRSVPSRQTRTRGVTKPRAAQPKRPSPR